jgi:hypothetical protein
VIANYTRPNLTEYQTASFFCSERFSLIEAGTKSGKTVGGIAWLVEKALAGRARHYWWVAPVYGQAKIAFDRMKEGLDPRLYSKNETDMSLRFPNGTTIVCKSGERPDDLFGEDVGAVVVDEASRVKEAAMHALRTTLTATRGPARIVGNVKGRKNWFFRMCRLAEAGEPDMKFSRITCLDAVDAGILDSSEIESAKRLLPANIFAELYMAEASDDGGNPFGLDAIERCIKPLSRKPIAVYGVDLAKHVDWTVNIGLDADGLVGFVDRYQLPWGATVKRIDAAIGGGHALVDSTGVGDPILERLQAEGAGEYEGYNFSAGSKQKLMEGLALAIGQGRIGFPAGPIAQELREYEYQYTRTGVRYSAPEGLHDDCVCALALAVEHLSEPQIRWTVA